MVKILKRLFSGDPNLRDARFAGLLYPRDKAELQSLVASAFDAIDRADSDRKPARAVVVPHSDPRMTADVVAAGLSLIDDPERIVLLGPSRRVPFRGVAATAAEGWDSPLGWLPVEREAYGPIADLPVARQLAEAHAAEPCLELQIPFLKHRFDDVPIVPVLVGDASIGDLATVLDRLWTDDAVLVVASELSEGLSADEAKNYDATTLELVASHQVDALDERQMSGRRIVQAMLEIATERGLTTSIVARKNSADAGGPAHATIGYCALEVS